MTEQDWVRAVGRVFQINPRIGTDDDTIWMKRRKEETALKSLLSTQGKSICLDGPSGVGKTSLALTTLEAASVPYVEIQITKNTDWQGLCGLVVEKLRDPTRIWSVEIQAALRNFVPSVDLKILFSNKTSYKDRLETIDAIASRMKEHDLAQWVSKANCILMIDDFEKSNALFRDRVADLAKILTQTYQSQHGKLLVVGTGDIYYHLYTGDKALEGRLAEVSLGTLPDKSWGWKYLCEGFGKLGLYHPSNSKYVRKQQKMECIETVFEACDGLLKTLTELGSRVCLAKSVDAESVSAKSITAEARKMPGEIFKKYRRRHPAIRRLLESDIDCRRVIETLYQLGIGKIHSVADIEAHMLHHYEYREQDLSAHLDRSVAALVDIEFLVRTGESGDVVYVTDPALAHNLGVAISHGAEYGIPKEYSSAFGQLMLPMRH